MRVCIGIAMLLVMFAVSAPAMELVNNGEARAAVVIDLHAPRSVTLAAQEFIAYIEKMSGVKLELIRGAGYGRKPMPERVVLIGDSPALRRKNISLDNLPDEGFLIKSTDDYLVIAGKDDIPYEANYSVCPGSPGTLYGVYTVLEELGVRWFYPNEVGTIVPKMPRITVKNQERQEKPYFTYRYTGYRNFEWRRRAKAGGSVDIWSTRHDVSVALRDQYRKSNPEWFFMDHNDRSKLGMQIDLNRPEVQDIMAKWAAERFESRTLPQGLKRFLVLPIDGTWEPEITSEWVTSAVEKLGWRMLKQYPESRVVLCPYNQYYHSPERIRKLPPNMELLIAQHREWLLDPESREESYKMIARWQEFQPAAIYFCRYNVWSLKMNPAFIPQTLSADFKQLARMSENGKAKIGGEMNFVEINPNSEFAWWEFLNEYVAAKLLWDPYLDINALLDDFCEKMFGPGAKEMREFIALCEKSFADKAQRDMFHLATIEKLDALLKAARAKTAGTEYAPRLAMFDRGFTLMRFVRDKIHSAQKAVAADKKSGCLASFSLNDGKGDLVKSSAGDLTGTIQNAQWRKNASRNELVFSGDHSAIRFGKMLDMPDGDYSVEAWVKPNRMGGVQAIVGPDAWGRKYFVIDYVNPSNEGTFTAKLKMQHRIGGSVKPDTFTLTSNVFEIKRNQWIHLAATFSTRNGMTLYKDGEIIGINPLVRTPSPLGLSYIGAGSNSNGVMEWCFSGSLADVDIYKRELSYGEVKKSFADTVSLYR